MYDAKAESNDFGINFQQELGGLGKSNTLLETAGDDYQTSYLDKIRLSVPSEDSGTIMLLAIAATLQNNVPNLKREKSLLGRLCDTVSSSVKLIADTVKIGGDMSGKKLDCSENEVATFYESEQKNLSDTILPEREESIMSYRYENGSEVISSTAFELLDISDCALEPLNEIDCKVRSWAEVVAAKCNGTGLSRIPNEQDDCIEEMFIPEILPGILELDEISEMMTNETDNECGKTINFIKSTTNYSFDSLIGSNDSKAEYTHEEKPTGLKNGIICNKMHSKEFVGSCNSENSDKYHLPCARKIEIVKSQIFSSRSFEFVKGGESSLTDSLSGVEQDDNSYKRSSHKKILQNKSFSSMDTNKPSHSIVKSSDKPDLGLEELSSLNVKSKFQVFEKGNEKNSELDRSPSKVDVKRSASILSKLAKFQKKGMDIGVTDEDLDGFVYEESSSEDEEDEDEVDDAGVIKCRKIREKPMSFGKMDDVKKSFESGVATKEQRMEERKQEIQNLRSRLFQGKQVKMKEMYEQAVAESEGKVSRKESDVVRSDKAKEFRERFEKGKVVPSDDEDETKPKIDPDELTVFEEGISKKSRSLFLEMDAKTVSEPKSQQSPQPKPKQKELVSSPRPIANDIVRASDTVEDVSVETADISSRFKFFEKYKAPEKEKRKFRITPPREGQVKEDSPDRELYRDPTVVRGDDKLEDEFIIKKSQTASKMLSIFKQMEEHKEVIPDGPKPKKEFTPPPDSRGVDSSEEEDDDEEEEETETDEEDGDGIIKSSSRVDDEFLRAKNAAVKARELAAKFESWEPDKQSGNNAVAMLESEQPSLESTKSLRAHFESLKNQKNQQESKTRPKVNRFVDSPPTVCSTCEAKVYPLEKIETDGRIFHKACFRCSHCNCILRMDSYTLNNGHLYCMPHFKQLFITKGNYDEGFGVDQHKRKWELSATPVNGSA